MATFVKTAEFTDTDSDSFVDQLSMLNGQTYFFLGKKGSKKTYIFFLYSYFISSNVCTLSVRCESQISLPILIILAIKTDSERSTDVSNNGYFMENFVPIKFSNL